MVKAKKPVLQTITPYLVPAILGLIGAGIVVASTSHFNAGVSTDSVIYISTARNIANGDGITAYYGPLIVEPPLFPGILAVVFAIFKMDPLLSARFVNAFLFGFVIFLSGLLFNRHLKSSPGLASLGTAYVLVSITLVNVSLMVWTEPLFICLVLLFLIFSERYIEKRGVISLLFLSLFASLASLTRYLGIVLIITGIFIILFLNREKWVTKIRHVSLFGSISILPLAAYLVRNIILSGSLIGYNPLPYHSVTFFHEVINIFHTAAQILYYVLSWYLPGQISTNLFLIFILSLAIGFIIGLEFTANWKKYSIRPQNYPILSFIVVYTSFFLLTVAYDIGSYNLEPRYLAPIFVPVTLLLLIFAKKMLLPLLGRLSQKYSQPLLMAVLAIGLIYPTLTTIGLELDQMKHGSGYTGEAWKNSEIIQYLLQHRSLESEFTIYSNANDAIYILTGLVTKLSPRNDLKLNGFESVPGEKGLWPPGSKVCLVWFDSIPRMPSLFSPDELVSIAGQEEVTRFQDGRIYIFSGN